MDVVYITTLVFLLTVVRSHDVKESLACYGAIGNPCTTHSLECGDHKIAILDAFYSNNSNCSTFGASACSNDIFQNYTVRLGELNMTDTDALYRNCSLQESCDYQAPRNITITFSVVHYMCIKETRTICDGNEIQDGNIYMLWNKTSHMNEDYTCSCSISSNDTEPTAVYALDMRPESACPILSVTSRGETNKDCTQNIQYQLLANTSWMINLEPVDVFDIFFINIRGNFAVNCSKSITTTTIISTITSTTTTTTTLPTTSTPTPTTTTTQPTTPFSTTTTTSTLTTAQNKTRNKIKEMTAVLYLRLQSLMSNMEVATSTSNYENATLHNKINPVARAKYDYALVSTPITHNGTTVPLEDDYNHINHNPPQSAPSYEYDTPASAAAAVKKLNNASSNSVDDDDYNHLGDGKPSVVSSDYDTTVSASKAVAQFGEMKDGEDDYDHFKRSEDKVNDSPYDLANHHIGVSADTTPNPYDLAK